MSAHEAREELARRAGQDFDPAVVRAFLSISLGRLRTIIGPVSWLAQLPILGSFPSLPAVAATTARQALTTVGAVAGVAALTVSGAVDAVPRATVDAGGGGAPPAAGLPSVKAASLTRDGGGSAHPVSSLAAHGGLRYEVRSLATENIVRRGPDTLVGALPAPPQPPPPAHPVAPQVDQVPQVPQRAPSGGTPPPTTPDPVVAPIAGPGGTDTRGVTGASASRHRKGRRPKPPPRRGQALGLRGLAPPEHRVGEAPPESARVGGGHGRQSSRSAVRR